MEEHIKTDLDLLWKECFDSELGFTTEQMEFISLRINEIKRTIGSRLDAEVKPACGVHHRTAKQFFIEQYQEDKCEDITTNPESYFDNNFYLNIYKLMEDYRKSV